MSGKTGGKPSWSNYRFSRIFDFSICALVFLIRFNVAKAKDKDFLWPVRLQRWFERAFAARKLCKSGHSPFTGLHETNEKWFSNQELWTVGKVSSKLC